MEHEIDYTIYRDAAELDGTQFFEIGRGRYSGLHWQEGFIFISEDAFAMVEGILVKLFPDYDHFAMNDIQKEIGIRIVSEWRDAATMLKLATSPTEAADILRAHESYRHGLEEFLFSDREKIGTLLSKLADECESFYQSNEWICVLGM